MKRCVELLSLAMESGVMNMMSRQGVEHTMTRSFKRQTH